VAVYVGYYDTHHSSHPKTKPSPWRGASNVTFLGTQDPGTTDGWDSSCIRVDNLGTTTLTGVTVKVTIGSHNYALWSAQSIAAGKTLIVAQTGFENFDGSDTSPAGCYGCDPKLCLTQVVSTKGVVHVTVGSRTTDYVDTGQILNTKGADGAGCPATGTRNDESSNWTRVFPTGVVALGGAKPDEASTPVAGPKFELAPLFPNPSGGDLQVAFSLPRRGGVRIAVFDVQGRAVKTYYDGPMNAGDYRGTMDLRGNKAGMYFLRVWTPQGSLQRSFVLMP
jgi:hypothetical protein